MSLYNIRIQGVHKVCIVKAIRICYYFIHQFIQLNLLKNITKKIVRLYGILTIGYVTDKAEKDCIGVGHVDMC